jgi:serine protease AprX
MVVTQGFLIEWTFLVGTAVRLPVMNGLRCVMRQPLFQEEHIMRFSKRVAATATAIVTFFFAMPGLADPVELVGEDGKSYVDTRAGPSADWAAGKIHPDVILAAARSESIPVMVYLQTPVQREAAAAQPDDIKARYRARIAVLDDQVKGILIKYQPTATMSEEDERAHAQKMQDPLSDADRDSLALAHEQIDRLMDDMRKEISAAVAIAGKAERAEVRALIAQASGRVTGEIELVNALAATLPSNTLNFIAAHPLVTAIVSDAPGTWDLNISMPSARYDTWWDDSYDGGAYDVGIADSGVQANHPAFAGLGTIIGHPGDTVGVDHGTHVAGIVVSGNATYTGGASGLDALIWASIGAPGPVESTAMDRMDWMVSGALQSPETINQSAGYGTATTDDYRPNDTFYDKFVDYFDVMIVNSAGNNGWDDVDPTVSFPANAYNLMSVANMNDMNTVLRTGDVRSATSSVGPTADSRWKPDIAAPGSAILSTSSEWNGATGAVLLCNSAATVGNDFVSCGGTSMAAPHVAAAIVLMEDGGNHVPLAQKAVLINTADAWTSNNTEGTGDDGPVTGSQWDKSYGWGYLDMWEAHFNRDDYFVDSLVPRNDSAADDDYKLYRGVMYADEKATMVWNKRIDTYVPGAPATGERTLSDLNLRLYRESDNVLADSEFNLPNNVHQVAADTFGTYVIKAYSWSTGFDGATSEQFALATEENFVPVSPPSYYSNYTRPNYVGPYQTFNIIVRAINEGGVGVHDSLMDVSNIAGVSGFSPTTIPYVAAAGDTGDEVPVTYTLTTSGLSAGTHWMPMTITGYGYDETYTFSRTSGVSLVVETTAPVATCTGSPTYSNGTQIDISWVASDAQTGVKNTYLYVWPPFGSGWAYTGQNATGTSGSFTFLTDQGDGNYLFAVRALDNGGNWENYPTTSECNTFVDTAMPTHTLTSPAVDTGGSIPLTFSVADAAPSSGLNFIDFWYKKDGDVFWTYTGQFSNAFSGTVWWLPTRGDGLYHFFSRPVDNAGNFPNLPSDNGDTSTLYATGVDSDGDGVVDTLDNCTLVPNADQRDSNGDGFGNICDPDLNNNGVVNAVDLGLFKAVFFTADADADFNGDGSVNAIDLGVMKLYFFLPPGPSGVAP